MERSIRRRLVALTLALAPCCLPAASDFDLGVHFLKDGDYYRAISSWERYRFMEPRGRYRDEALRLIGNAYFAGGRWGMALKRLKETREQWAGKPAADLAHYFQAEAAYEDGRLRLAQELFEELGQVTLPPLHTRFVDLRLASLDIAAMRWSEAAGHFKRLSGRDPGLENNPALRWEQQSLDMAAWKAKSPWLTVGASALIPGSGQALAGYYWDGFSAFTLVASFAAWAWVSYENGGREWPWVFGGLSGVFYLGNLQGAFNAAKRSKHEVPEREGKKILNEIGRLEPPQPSFAPYLE